MDTKVSVIMPVYNAAGFVLESVQSILSQTLQDFELIVIDDGSTDASGEIISAIKDSRIRLIRNETNRGVTPSLNIGLEQACGRYVARMDADDISLPKRLEIQTSFMEQNDNIVICGCFLQFMGKRNHILTYPVDNDAIKCHLLIAPPFAHPSVVMKRSVLLENKIGYDESLRYAQDYDLWLKLLQVGAGANVDEPLVKYREHPGQVSNWHREEQDQAANLVKARLFSLLGIEVTDAELDLHNSFFRGELLPEVENLQRVEKWLLKLIRASRQSKFFDKDKLHRLIAGQWNRYIEQSGCLGWPSWIFYKKSPLREMLSVGKKRQLIHLFKCLRAHCSLSLKVS